MKPEQEARLHHLCRKAAVEHELDKFLELIAQINQLLGEKEQRLRLRSSQK